MSEHFSRKALEHHTHEPPSLFLNPGAFRLSRTGHVEYLDVASSNPRSGSSGVFFDARIGRPPGLVLFHQDVERQLGAAGSHQRGTAMEEQERSISELHVHRGPRRVLVGGRFAHLELVGDAAVFGAPTSWDKAAVLESKVEGGFESPAIHACLSA